VTVPTAYSAVKLAGAAYLGWLAWYSPSPGGISPLEARSLEQHTDRRLFASRQQRAGRQLANAGSPTGGAWRVNTATS
jgi:threonine/homoserine/homoserine lactone efflux protein